MIPATTTASLSSRGWRPATRVAAAVVETRDEGQNLRGSEEETRGANRPLWTSGDHPHFFPLSSERERARALARLPPRRGCLDSLGNRRHTGTEFHGWREPARVLRDHLPGQDPSVRRFSSVAITRTEHRKPPACRNSMHI